jgi:hypothetical protein
MSDTQHDDTNATTEEGTGPSSAIAGVTVRELNTLALQLGCLLCIIIAFVYGHHGNLSAAWMSIAAGWAAYGWAQDRAR